MKSQDELVLSLRAGYSFFYAQTFEHERAISLMSNAMINFKNKSGNQVYFPKLWDYETSPDAEQVLEYLDKADNGTVMIAKNYHWHLIDEMQQINKMTIQWIQNRIECFSADDQPRRALIIIGSKAYEKAIPEELQREILKLDFDLPDEEERKEILDYIIESVEDQNWFEMPDSTGSTTCTGRC